MSSVLLFRRPAGRRHFSGLQWLCYENRSKELGLYKVLGMEKHLLVMTLRELLIFCIPLQLE